MTRPKLLALVPNPRAAPSASIGGIVAASRMLFAESFQTRFDVRIVDTTMRPFPVPTWEERISSAAIRAVRTMAALGSFQPEIAVAYCGEGTSFYEKSLMLLLAKRRGARAYLSLRSGYAEAWLRRSPSARRWVAHVGRALDGFIVQSCYWRDVYRSVGVPADKLFVWYNAVDSSEWASLVRARDARVPNRRFRFLFLGWAIPLKGIPELVSAVERLASIPGPEFELIIGGDGECARRLRFQRDTGQLPPNIHLLGWVDAAGRAEQMVAADALVLPTHAEGFPNVVLEAMACALPVISTPVGALPEVVVHGDTGLLVPVKDVEALANAMHRLRTDPERARQMGRRGLKVVQTKFERDNAITRIAAILTGCCATLTPASADP